MVAADRKTFFSRQDSGVFEVLCNWGRVEEVKKIRVTESVVLRDNHLIYALANFETAFLSCVESRPPLSYFITHFYCKQNQSTNFRKNNYGFSYIDLASCSFSILRSSILELMFCKYRTIESKMNKLSSVSIMSLTTKKDLQALVNSCEVHL